MGKLIIIIAFIGALLWGFFVLKDRESLGSPSKLNLKESSGSLNDSPSNVEITSRSIFVPYWNVENLESTAGKYDRLIYFGVSATENGVNREDVGFANMQTFASRTANIPTLLTLRMLDSDTNIVILENEELQKKIAEEVADIAQKYNFAGVVLDLELSVIPFTNVKNQISDFVTVLDSELESRSLHFAVALYGDTYFRGRPYDVKRISQTSDEILIMAYDFHKSRGEPGPNYPLNGSAMYGYDFKKMINDFSQYVPRENITVVFGMYGYNWTLGKQGKPLKAATAFSLNDANEMFYPNCNYRSCTVLRDVDSAETKVMYMDAEGYNHVAWFEDEKSVAQKSEYLKQQGIGSISYWVYGYF